MGTKQNGHSWLGVWKTQNSFLEVLRPREARLLTSLVIFLRGSWSRKPAQARATPCRPTLDLRILKPLGCCETACGGCFVTLGAGTADGGQLVSLICRQSSQGLHACTAHLTCSSSQSTLQLACEEALFKATVLLWLNSSTIVFSVIYCVCMVVQLAPGFNSQIFSRTYEQSSSVPGHRHLPIILLS